MFARITAWIGALCGLAGLATILPPLGETAGAVFGLGAIMWFVVAGLVLLRQGQTSSVKEVSE